MSVEIVDEEVSKFDAIGTFLIFNRVHILDVSVNANPFSVQCSVLASAALTRHRVLH